MLSVMLSAHSLHSQKFAVSRCGRSSNSLRLSSVADTEMDTISNWNNRPSQSEVKARPQLGLEQCDTMRVGCFP